jgi:hypothetical protein
MTEFGEDARDPAVVEWLLQDEQPSVRYYTLLDLLGRTRKDPEVRRARAEIPKKGWARDLLALQKPGGYWEAREPRTLREWFNFLYFPKFRSTFWRALVLSDLGLDATHPPVKKAAEVILEYKLRFSSPLNFFYEEASISGNTARMMTRFGYAEDRRVRKLYDWLLEDQREDGGWSGDQNTPGTLEAWEPLAALAALPKSKRSPRAQRAVSKGAEFYLARRLFHEGKRHDPWFRFHYPVHYYYDVLVGLDLLTSLGYAGDRRLRPALRLLRAKRRRDGRWNLDRVHPDIEPGPDRAAFVKTVRPFTLERAGQPSKWVTLTALRVLKRVEAAG